MNTSNFSCDTGVLIHTDSHTIAKHSEYTNSNTHPERKEHTKKHMIFFFHF